MLGFFGAVLGGVGLSVLTFTYHAIFYPDLVGEDSYFVHYLLTAPIGACLGAGAIYGLTLVQTEPKRAARAYFFGVAAATLVCIGLAYWQGLKLLSSLLEAMLFYLPVSISYFLCLFAGIFAFIGISGPKKLKTKPSVNQSVNQNETNKPK
jgi:TRAP-type C4-dicarboxylate transport system permease small subunit